MRFYIRFVTLRSVEKGWYAEGLLEPLWLELDPPTAKTLAALAGVNVQTLHNVNGGSKRIGIAAARKIAVATGRTIYDIGYPKPAENVFATSLLGQIVQEIERNPPTGPAPHLLELAASLRRVADRLEGLAGSQDAGLLPG